MSTLISYLYAQSNITKYVNVNVYPNISQRDIYEDKKNEFFSSIKFSNSRWNVFKYNIVISSRIISFKPSY